MNIGKILNSLDDKLGMWIFKNNNIFSYNIFTYFYEKNIINHHSDLIENYQKKGFLKGPKINPKLIEQLNAQIKKQEIKKNSENFALVKWNNNLKEILKEIIFKELEQIIIKLQKYYNSKIILTHARIQRNYGYEKHNLEEKFSDNFHNDRWLSTYLKIFINLEDIGYDKGPTSIIPRNKKEEFIKVSKYKNRKNYIETNFKDAYINVGKIGESLIFNPSICLHKAGNPLVNNTRDMLMLQFSAIPNEKNAILELDKLNINMNEEIFADHDKLSYKYAKPYGFYKTFKLYKKFKENLKLM